MKIHLAGLFCIWFLLFLALSRAQAAPTMEPSLKQASLHTVMTSDGIDDRAATVSYRNHRRDLFWPYSGEAQRAWDYELDGEFHQGDNTVAHYQGVKAALGGGRKFSEHLLLEIAGGYHRLLNTTSQDSFGIAFGALKAQLTPLSSLDMTLKASHDFVYQDLIQPGAVTGWIRSKAGFLDGTYRPWEPIKVGLRSSFQHFNDGNERRSYDGSLMYGLSRGTPWVWAGVGSEYLSFTGASTSISYWSPQRFFAFGPRFEAVVPVWGLFSVAAALNVNRFQEEDTPWGWGYYGNAQMEYGRREGFAVSIAYTRIRSARDESQWFSNGVGLSLRSAL